MNRYMMMAIFFMLACTLGISVTDGEYSVAVPAAYADKDKDKDKDKDSDKNRGDDKDRSDDKDSKDDDKKVTICHNGSNTLSVSESAVSAHLTNHGDTLGACPASCVCPQGIGSCTCPDGSPGTPSPGTPSGPETQRSIHGH